MVLTKDELIATLQNEIRILLHLAGKIEPSMLDYRPSEKQRSTIELLRYMTHMGPLVIAAIKKGDFDGEVWQAAVAKAAACDFQEVVALIEAQSAQLAELVAPMTDEELRGSIEMFGRTETRGYLLVNMVLGSFAAYRMQLFLYLKACGREELNTMNLWGGVDAPMSN